MKSEDPNVEALSRAVMRDAHGDAEQILAEARQKAEVILKQAQQQADAKRDEIVAQANREAQRIRSEATATAQLKARKLQLEQREKLLDEVFEAARRELPTIQQGTDYEKIARLLLREAVEHLEVGQVRVRADEKTRKFLADGALDEISKEAGVAVQLGDTLEHGLGVFAETMDGHRQYDNTLETRLVRLQDTLRMAVYHLLMGEPL